MITSLISRLVILTCGTLYPAYRSYKAVKTKSVRDYVKWMMYWIVFALFLCAETVADVFISWWMPFYYEVKIIFLLWLLSPYTKGSSILYRRFVHPMLTERENEIDDVIARARQEGYRFIFRAGSQGLTMLTTLALQLVARGPSFLDQLRSGFDNDQRAHSSLDSPRQQQLPPPPPPQQQQRQLDRNHREEPEFEAEDGREIAAFETKMEIESGDFDEFDEGSLPDVPSVGKNADVGGNAFRVPEAPPAGMTKAAAGDRKAGAKTGKRSGKSPGRTASASRKNAVRKSDEVEGNLETPTSTFSDASDLDDYDGGDSQRKNKKRDANANINAKGRSRRPATGPEGETVGGRDRSKTKISKSKSGETATTTGGSKAGRDVAFGDLEDLVPGDDDDDALILLSSDDEEMVSAAVPSRKGKKPTTTVTTTTTSAGAARQRKQIKKKTEPVP